MATVRTVTVKSAGGDYTSLSAAESGEQADLVSLDRQLNIECYAMVDTAAVTIDGWTTDATRYINIYAPEAEGHSGIFTTSKYVHQVSTTFTSSFVISEDYVRLTRLQIDQGHLGSTDRASGVFVTGTAAAASSDIILDSCIVRSCGRNSSTGGIFGGSGKVTVYNSIVYGCSTGLRCTFNTSACTMDCYNVTACTSANYAYHRDGGTMTLTNCYSGNSTTADYSGTITRTSCAHSSSINTFPGSTRLLAHSTANFVSVTAGSEDYHLVETALLRGMGTDLSATFTVDIDGDTRSDGAWDIGADEYAAAGGGTSVTLATIASAVALNAPTVSPGAATVALGTIASTAVLYTATVVPAAVDVVGAHIASQAATQAPTIAPGSASVSLASIAAAETLHAPTASPGAVTVEAAHIASAVALNVPVVSQGGVSVGLATIASVAALGAPSFSVGAASVAAATIASAVSMNAPTLAYRVSCATIAAAAVVRPPSLALSVAGASIASVAALAAPTVAAGGVDVALATIASAAELHAPLGFNIRGIGVLEFTGESLRSAAAQAGSMRGASASGDAIRTTQASGEMLP